MYWTYKKIDENLKEQYCPKDDYDGSVTGTGKCILNVKAWFDENPEERKRLGWIKHIQPDLEEEGIEYDKQTQYITWSTEQVDEYTLCEVPHICNKSEEMMRLEELLESSGMGMSFGGSGLVFSPAF